MKKILTLSTMTFVLISNTQAADSLESAFKEGKASGQIRMFYIDRDYKGYNTATNYHRDGLALGGYLKYETAPLYGFNVGAAFYTTNKLDKKSSVTGKNDTTLFGPNGDNKTYLGEAYLQYKYENTTFKAGRQKLDTPMAGSDDARELPNLFEAYVLSNTDIKDTTLIAAHVTKFAAGTFANAYGGGVLALTSGYSGLSDATKYVGSFTNMGTYAIGKSTKGVTTVGAIYSGIPGLKLQLWDYYAYDILNAIYAEANVEWKCLISDAIKPYAGVQYIKEDDVGKKYATKVNSDFIAAKAGAKFNNFDLSFALSHNSKDSSAKINGGTITPWGGMPAYTQGMVTRHQFMAGTDAWKVAGNYNWKDFGVNLNTALYYAEFDMDKLNGYSDATASDKATEAGFDIIYNPEAVKNLQLRFRGNFPRHFKETTAGNMGWNEYRFIANYNF